MMISLHKNATTTPSIRQQMSGSEEPLAVQAQRYGVGGLHAALSGCLFWWGYCGYAWSGGPFAGPGSHLAPRLGTYPANGRVPMAEKS